MQNLTPEAISKATGADIKNVSANWPGIVDALDWAGINTPLVQVGMAATIAIETGVFKPLQERRAKQGTDLYKLQNRYWPSGFYGRGYIQLTWGKHYMAAGAAIGADLAGCPDLAMEPTISARIAAWYFLANKIHLHCDGRNWEMVRCLVNGPQYFREPISLRRFLNFCALLESA